MKTNMHTTGDTSMKTKNEKAKKTPKKVLVCAMTSEGFERRKLNIGEVRMKIPVCGALEKKAS